MKEREREKKENVWNLEMREEHLGKIKVGGGRKNNKWNHCFLEFKGCIEEKKIERDSGKHFYMIYNILQYDESAHGGHFTYRTNPKIFTVHIIKLKMIHKLRITWS